MKMVKLCFAFANFVDVLISLLSLNEKNGAKENVNILEWQKQNGQDQCGKNKKFPTSSTMVAMPSFSFS
jgi:hypothetical protein